ncbi:MAG: hypothetical protein DCC88_07395 [Spirobacillus cienkowskii]|jgi:RHS repeat-associated protein|uniref:Teneurin-like YD-shell domain-containing protein n=1 Tax=Spirobacillus cienkowskii TaxID=495820 RepID=A0A369KQV1_9BACT|nr:MAG: hypothetical protein DCC88_07395 [Spirobacillus cienkowskii]
MHKNELLRKIMASILPFAIISGFIQPLAFAKGMQFSATSTFNETIEMDKSDSSLPPSDAINFSSFKQSVDPRTGTFSINYPIFDIKSSDFESPSFQLLLKYNSLFTGHKYFDVGKGWSWNMSHYDSKSNMIYLSNGGAYKVDFSKKNLMKNYLLKDIFLEFNNNFIIINYKNGNKEFIYKENGNLFKIENLTGKAIYFDYNQKDRLNLIYYKDSQTNQKKKVIEIQYNSDKFITVKKFIDKNKYISNVIKKSFNGNYLDSITNPQNQSTNFEYKVPINKNYDSKFLISSIKSITGTEIKVNYLKEGLGSENGRFFPAVSKVVTASLPKNKYSSEVIHYYYNEKNNYLGKGFVASIEKNEDKLFYTPNNYVYSSIEKKLAPDQKILETERNYNHFHLLLSEKTKLNGSLVFLKEYEYPEWKSKKFEDLSESYNLPIQVKETYFNDNKFRIELSKFSYDKFGNLVRQELPNGMVNEYTYLSQDETFNKLTHLLKQEKQYSIYDDRVKIVENKYKKLKNYIGNDVQFLEEKLHKVSRENCINNSSFCEFIYKKEQFIYDFDFNKKSFFSLPSKVIVTGFSLNGYNKSYQNVIKYESNDNFYKIQNSYYSAGDVLLETEFKLYNSFTGSLVKQKTKNGILNEFEYDLFGRVKNIYLTNEDGKKYLSKNYFYNVNNKSDFEGYGTSSKLVQNLDGKIEFTVYDSLGRVINIYQKNHKENKFYPLKSYSYGVTGQKIEEKNYNIDAENNLYFLVHNYQYDYIGRKILEIQPSGVQSLSLYDDIQQIVTNIVQSPDKQINFKTVTYNNKFKLPVREDQYNAIGSLVQQKNWSYDSFGNKIKFVDANGSSTFYEYNNLLQLVKISNARMVSFIYSYDPLYIEKPVAIYVMQNGKQEKLLAYQKYNELGRKIVDGDSFGKETRYIYDSNGNLVTKVFKSGIKTNYYYNNLNLLDKEESVSVNGNKLDTFYYEYDPETLLLQSESNSSGKLKYTYDKNGNLLSVTYPNEQSILYLHDFYGKIISLTDIKGLKTTYHYSSKTGLLESTQVMIPGQEELYERYFYDSFGRLSSKIMPNKIAVNYEYNDNGKLSNMSYLLNDNAFVLGYSFKYYDNGNLLSKERFDNNILQVSSEIYKYNEINNLSHYSCAGNYCPKSYNGTSIVAENFEFDDLNNIKEIKTTYLDGGSDLIKYNYSEINPVQLVSIMQNNNERNFKYNDDGQMIKDDQGNQFFYNSSQKIEKIKFSHGNENFYFYLANGSLYVNTESNGNSSYIYYHGNKVINQTDNEKVTSYFLGNNNIIGQIYNTDLKPLFYLTDQANSVIKTVDSKNENIQNVSYSPYGEVTNLISKQENYNNKLSYGFNGELTDSSSGLQILGNGYRAYNPKLRRFIQYDVHSPFGKGGINGYIFANNNPIMFQDPTGESATSAALLGVGVTASIVGIALSFFTFGASLGWSVAGLTAMASQATTQFALATTGLVTGIASGATGIASSAYSYKASAALEAGNKNEADYYNQTSKNLGWASLGLGIASAVSGVGVNMTSSVPKTKGTNDFPLYYKAYGNQLNSTSSLVPEMMEEAAQLNYTYAVNSDFTKSFPRIIDKSATRLPSIREGVTIDWFNEHIKQRVSFVYDAKMVWDNYDLTLAYEGYGFY